MSMQWEGKFGPAAILAVVQLVLLAVGGVYTYARLENTAANTAVVASSLQTVVEHQQQRTDALNERMITVEVNVRNMADSITRLITKIDRDAAKP